MPVVHFHLSAEYPSSQIARLLEQAAQRYAQVLESPIDRVRAFAVRYPPGHYVTGGSPASDSAAAPYFTALVLAGRPESQRQALLAAFTGLVVEELGVPRESVRGRIEEVDPADWGIGGVPASIARAEEIRGRSPDRG